MSGDEALAPQPEPAKKKPDVRVYLEEKVFPILTRGLEDLLRAVEEREKILKDTEEEEVPEIHPLLFLARYLMRNSPGKSGKTSPRSNPIQQGEEGGSESHVEAPTEGSPESAA